MAPWLELTALHSRARLRVSHPFASRGASELRQALTEWFEELPAERNYELTVRVRYRTGARATLCPRAVRAPLQRADLDEAHGGHEALLTEIGRHAGATAVAVELEVLMLPSESDEAASAGSDEDQATSRSLSSVTRASSARYARPPAFARRAASSLATE